MQMSKDLEVCILISACIHCLLAQVFPYVSFNGHTLANHSYVELSAVGHDARGSDSIRCHTDLSTCCTSNDGGHRGDWYFPNRTRLPFSSGVHDIYERRLNQKVNVGYRWQNTPTSGIYRCDIPTISVHDDTDIRDRVYIGLYLNGGEQWYNYSNTNPPPN